MNTRTLMAGCIGLAFCCTRSEVLGQTLDGSWVVSVNGQTVRAYANGGFRIPNVAAPDQFGAGGPGSSPDFLSDDYLRIIGSSTQSGRTRYLFSSPFRIRQRQTYTVGDLIITDTPPPFPQSLRLTASNQTLTQPGQTQSLQALGRLNDGTEQDVTPQSSWTSYRTSNLNIANVDANGVVTAIGEGTAFITAINEGATAIIRINVAPADPLTVVEGYVQGSDGPFIADAEVTLLGQGLTARTDSSGHFVIPGAISRNADRTPKDIQVHVTAPLYFAGDSTIVSAMSAMTTDVGIVRLTKIPSNPGREFGVAFQRNYDNANVGLSLFVSGNRATTGWVDVPGLGLPRQNFSVTPGVITTVSMPTSVLVSADNGTVPNGVVVHAEDDVVVYGLNRAPFTTDAYAGLPIDTWGMRYRPMCHVDLGGSNNRSQFAVIAAQDNTVVTITPSTSANGRTAGVPFNITLNRMQVYQLRSNVNGTDLTGSLITADAPIGVFSGNSCANVPSNRSFCDHLVEQMPPTDSWGLRVITLPLATRLNGDTFRILADQNGTNVQILGPTPAGFTLNAGQYSERILTGNNEIIADRPILVCQFANGGQYDARPGDPFMCIVPPSEQFLPSYTFSTPAIGFPTNYVNVIARTTDAVTGGVILDGAAVPLGQFQNIAGTEFSCAKIPVVVGSHTIRAGQPLGIYVYGFNRDDSYGYPGGLALAPRPPRRFIPDEGPTVTIVPPLDLSGVDIAPTPASPGFASGSPEKHGPVAPLTKNAQGTRLGSTSTTVPHASVTLSNGRTIDLGTLGGATSVATGINASGQVCGYSQVATGEFHAFRWIPDVNASGGTMHDLGTVGGPWSRAAAIADNGDVVGESATADSSTAAFLYHAATGELRALPSLGSGRTAATCIAPGGLVGGWATTGNGAETAVVWGDDGQIIALADLLGAGSGWTVRRVTSVSSNSSGEYEVFGAGQYRGVETTFSLVIKSTRPVPGDINGDRRLDEADLVMLLANIESGDPCCDITGDSVVDEADVKELMRLIAGE
ncbi:MAG: hypothetical protein JSR77_14825 [Planctomycetes bacterium]|nr:hypothetical protein [Planctomycetota bacterium]